MLRIVCSLAVICMISWSFQKSKTPNIEELKQAALQEKITSFKLKERQKCHKKIIDKAIHIVDSTLIARAKKEQLDSIQRPAIPPKPSLPEIRRAKDTSIVKPVIE